jgi:formate/nitrite transporter FocA (FNT family)
VTLGNIVGGALLVAAVYWLVYLRPAPPEKQSAGSRRWS